MFNSLATKLNKLKICNVYVLGLFIFMFNVQKKNQNQNCRCCTCMAIIMKVNWKIIIAL